MVRYYYIILFYYYYYNYWLFSCGLYIVNQLKRLKGNCSLQAILCVLHYHLPVYTTYTSGFQPFYILVDLQMLNNMFTYHFVQYQ